MADIPFLRLQGESTSLNAESIGAAVSTDRYSFAKKAARQSQHRDTQINNSLRSLDLLRAFFPANSADTPEAIRLLSDEVQAGKKLDEAFAALPSHAQQELYQKAGVSLGELVSISSSDEAGYWMGALHLGLRLKNSPKPESSFAIFQMLSQEGVPPEIREQAILEAKALTGQGGNGMRTEVLLGSFAQQATDYRMIVPMVGGAFIGKAVGTFVLGRFAGGARALSMVEALGARFAAGSIGFFAETTAFGLGSHYLSGSTNSVSDDLLRAGLSLGALRFCGFLGNQAFLRLHRFNELGVPARLSGLAKFTQAAMPQIAVFGGMMGAHKLEEEWGLRKKVADSTAVSDTLASMLSMGVGSRLGHRLLGREFAQLEKEMLYRSNSATRFGENKLALENASAEPWSFSRLQPLLAQGPRVFTMEMSGPKRAGSDNVMLTLGSGPSGSGAGKPFRLGGINATDTIRSLTHLEGLPIETLESGLRPKEEGSLRWIGAKENLKDVLAKDNDFVLSKGITHQDVARELRVILAKGTKQLEDKMPFTLNGEPWTLIHHQRTLPFAPVFPGIAETSDGFTLLNNTTGRSLYFQANQLDLIEQYGFYGGEKGTHRMAPEQILTLFPHIARNSARSFSEVSDASVDSAIGKQSNHLLSPLGHALAEDAALQSTAPAAGRVASSRLNKTVAEMGNLSLSNFALTRLFDFVETVIAGHPEKPFSALMEYLKQNVEVGSIFRQLEKNYANALESSGHQALYSELGITPTIQREVLAGSFLLASLAAQLGHDPFGFVDYLNGLNYSIDVKTVALFFEVPFRSWTGEVLDRAQASAQEMVIQAAQSDPILMAMLTLQAARGLSWAEEGLRKIERDRASELRDLVAEQNHGFLGVTASGFSQEKGDNPFHDGDTFVLAINASATRAIKKAFVPSGNPQLDPYLEDIHRGDWVAINKLVDRARSDVLAFKTLLDLAKTHEGGRWIVELALDGEKICQDALIEAAKTEKSIRSFLVYLSPKDHPWVLPFQMDAAPPSGESLNSPQVFFHHRRAQSGDEVALESLRSDALERFRLGEIFEKPEIYATELGDLILLAKAGNILATKFIEQLWPVEAQNNAQIRRGFVAASRSNYEVLSAFAEFARRGVPWAKQTLEVYQMNALISDLIADSRALSGLLSMAQSGNEPAAELATRFFDLLRKMVSGLKLRVEQFPTDRYLLSAMAKLSANALHLRTLASIESALAHYGETHGMKGLNGRVQRGLDPAGMLAMPDTRALVAEIAHALGAKLENVEELTRELHVGGIWKNAERLARASDPAVQTWMILAHLTAEGEMRPDDFIHDWNRLARDLNEAATDPHEAIALARKEVVERAKENFVLMDEAVPFSTKDAFLHMAIAGHRFGVVQENADLLFVGADRLDYDVVESQFRLLPIVRQDRGREVTFYVNEQGQDVLKRLYPGFAIVLNGDLELAKVLAKTATQAQPSQSFEGEFLREATYLLMTDHLATVTGVPPDAIVEPNAWPTLLERYSQHAPQLVELQKMIVTAEEAKRKNSELKRQLEVYFSHIEHNFSRSLLADLLWWQLEAKGKAQSPLQAEHEAEQVLKELNLETFARSRDAQLAPEALVEKLLLKPRN